MQLLRLIDRVKFTFVLAATAFGCAAHAWEPTKPVEFVIPAGTGGGADQMARFIQGLALLLLLWPLVSAFKGMLLRNNNVQVGSS